MIKRLAPLWSLLIGRLYCVHCRRPNDASHCNGCHNAPKFCVCDVVDLVPAACDECGNPIAYCSCAPATGLLVPHDLSDYDDYVAAALQKCQGPNCSIMTTLLAGDVFPDSHDGPAVPMCLACQALLDEAAAR